MYQAQQAVLIPHEVNTKKVSDCKYHLGWFV